VTARQAEEYLLGLELFGMRFGLDRMHRLMTVLGLPQRRFASIHVVGTNGKSSTVRFCAAILERHGLRTGSYTSPHLGSFRERIEVGEQPVAEADFAAAPVHKPGAVDYTRYLDPDGLRGVRIGVARDVFVESAVAALVDEVLPLMAAAGATIVDPVGIIPGEPLASSSTEYALTLMEFPFALEWYLAAYAPDGPIYGLTDIVAFNEAHAEEALVYFDQSGFYDALAAPSIWDDAYAETARGNLAWSREYGIDATMDAYELDALIAPTTGAPTAISLDGDDFPGACSQVSAMAGYPILNVPLGDIDGLPVGLSFMGRAFSEPTLLRLAYAFERIHPARRPPEYAGPSTA